MLLLVVLYKAVLNFQYVDDTLMKTSAQYFYI